MSSRAIRQAKRKHIERVVLLGLAVITVIAVVFAWSNLMGHGPAPLMGLFGLNRVNILVLGVDERPDDVGRSDTMLVLAINPKEQDVSVLSVPRDTRVKIQGFGFDKINHAYANGKYKLSQRAVEDLLGIKINYYVTIDFNGFKRIIDALGGVTIDVEKRMYYTDPYDNLVIDLQPGVQKLNGENAIAYVRYRDEEGDIGRIGRQQKFLKAVMEQVTKPETIGRLPTLIRELSGAVQTNMSVGDMINYAKIFNTARVKGLRSYMVPGTPAYIDDISYWLPDIVATREMVAEITGAKMDTAAAKQLAAEYEQSIPGAMKVVPKEDKPKTAAAEKDKNSQNAKPAMSKDAQKPPAKTNPGKLRAEVINASGSEEAAYQVVNELRSRGFEVVSIVNSGSQARATTVIDHTGNDAVLTQVRKLNFDYDYVVAADGARNADITVRIGRNYR